MIKNRELLLFRHAQAESYSAKARDFDRTLTEHGRAQPEVAAKEILTAGFAPQLVLCSSSARTRETLSLLIEAGLGAGAEVVFSESIYECTTRQILTELSAVEETIERILLVGHNPGLSDLATALSHRQVGLNPGDYAWLSFEHDWSALGSGPVALKS